MKKLLLPFALLFTIPFNTSCIKEITFDVIVTGDHCSWDEPVKKAVVAKDYVIKIVPDDGYQLYLADTYGDGIFIESENGGPIVISMKDEQYDTKTSTLTIPGGLVTSKITIHAVGQPKDEI